MQTRDHSRTVRANTTASHAPLHSIRSRATVWVCLAAAGGGMAAHSRWRSAREERETDECEPCLCCAN